MIGGDQVSVVNGHDHNVRIPIIYVPVHVNQNLARTMAADAKVQHFDRRLRSRIKQSLQHRRIRPIVSSTEAECVRITEHHKFEWFLWVLSLSKAAPDTLQR